MNVIRVENVKKIFTYGIAQPVEALRGVSFEIKGGESVAIMGPSGAGKSTLLQILGTLDKPTEGKILYDDLDIQSLSSAGLAKFRNSKIGFVFQFHHLLPEFSAVENVMLPALIEGKGKREARKMAEQILDKMELGDRLDHRPGELSGGEQQRVAVARAAVLKPDIILADEPTGNLDTVTGEKIFQLLLQLNREEGMTLVVVTHSPVLAGKLGKIINMADGRILNRTG